MNDHTELPADFESLVAAAIDGSLTPADRARLGELVATNPAARDFYLDYLATHAVLQWSHDALPAMILPTACTPARAASAGRTNPRQIAPIAWSVAAALLLAAAAVAIYILASAGTQYSTPSDPSPIATLVDATGTVIINDDVANPGSDYTSGSYSIDSGSAQFILRNQVSVEFRGATRMQLISPMHARLTRGAATFYCPEGTEGFTLDLPHHTRIVDLGTRFIAQVKPDGTVGVRVLEGEVEIRRGGVAHAIHIDRRATISDHDIAFDTVLARYRAEFPTSAEAVESGNWAFLSCVIADADNPSAYKPLDWVDVRFGKANWGALAGGDGTIRDREAQQFSGANHGRFSIVAYTIDEHDAGRLAIADSMLIKNVADDPIAVRIAVNDRLVRELVTDATTTEPSDFDTDLGVVRAGDTVYVMFGGRPDWMSGTFYHDFSIVAREDDDPADAAPDRAPSDSKPTAGNAYRRTAPSADRP